MFTEREDSIVPVRACTVSGAEEKYRRISDF